MPLHLRPHTLTFDDGPDPDWTPRILQCLREQQACATFFVIAPRAQRHPQLIARMLREGHDVQLHCDLHRRHTDLSESELRQDVSSALTRLAALGVSPGLWRTPWGVCTTATYRVAGERGLRLTGWDLDTHDWRGDTAEVMHESIAARLREDSVVLMHDGIGPGARRKECRQTLRLIPLLLNTLRDRRPGSHRDRAGLDTPIG